MVFLLFLCILCILPVCSIFEATCPRKDPSPGVLVVSPGSSLVLTCSGDVKVNGAKVILNGSSNNKKRPALGGTPATKHDPSSRMVSSFLQNTVSEKNFSSEPEAGVRSVPGGNRSLRYSDGGHMVGPTSISRTTTGDSGWEDEEKKDDEEGKEGSRFTRGVPLKHHWKRSKLLGQKRDGHQGEITVISQEEVLSLDSVTTTDSGKYACHGRGEEKFAVKVIVADPPESPSLSCYKKSHSSKIRCEWRPQKPVMKHPNCRLVLKIGKTEKWIPCSYSLQHSQCWCALDYDEDEKRTLHVASLCVTSILGNAISPPLRFKPVDILKPDPPSNISAQQEDGQERRIKVTWNLPRSWMEPGNFYILLYEIRYRPVTSMYEQVNNIKKKRSYTIIDALPGNEYLIQLRSKDEYDGQWSEWSPPVYARSWMARDVETDNFTTLPDGLDDGSGLPDQDSHEGPKNGTCFTSDDPSKIPQYVFWISGLFAFLSAILAIYIFRLKDNYFSKLHKLIAITWCGDLSPPSPPAPAAPKEETLVTFVPQLYEERPPSDIQEEEENEEEQNVTGRVETMNFNNTSYFFLQSEI